MTKRKQTEFQDAVKTVTGEKDICLKQCFMQTKVFILGMAGSRMPQKTFIIKGETVRI